MALLLIFLLLPQSLQSTAVPDVRLRISFRERTGTQLSKPVYVLEVSCEDGECSYTYVSLNDCGPGGNVRNAFFPKVESASTKNGDVTATNEGAVLTLVQKGVDSFGAWTNTFRIGYQPTRDGTAATRVVSFSGDFIKTSELIQRPTRIDYIPFEGPFQILDIECPMVAPGVDRQ